MSSNQRIIKGLAIGLAFIIIFTMVSIAFNILTGITGFFEDDNITYNTYDIIGVSDIDINIKASNLVIKNSDTNKIEIPNYASYNIKNNKLVIKENKKSNLFKKSVSTITIYISYKNMFDNVTINGGAGNINIDDLKVNDLYLNLGAGKVTINKIDVLNNFTVDGGAGNFEIIKGNLKNVDIDMGIGNFDIKAAITGKGKIDVGVGNLNINLIDGLNNYTFDIDKGIGTIKLNNTKVSEGKYGNGNTEITIDGGIGNIDIY